MKKATAVIYLRVSTGRQAEKELPLDSQEEQCRRLASELGAEVVRVFSDKGISGRTDARPEFQDAVTYCETFGTQYFICWSTSRFARDALDARLYKRRLEKADVKVRYVSVTIDKDTDSGFLQEAILEIFDEYFSRQVATDTRRSMTKNARDGYWNGGRAPFGFRVVPSPDNPKKLVLQEHPDESPIVRQMFAYRVKGVGTKQIAVKLNESGVLRRGAKWSKATVGWVLRNERMIGKSTFGRRRHGGSLRPQDQWLVVDSHKGIIDPEVFANVQSMMDSDTCLGSPKSTWLFTGMVRCAACDLAMLIESAKGRSARYYYYNCASAQKGLGCANRRLSAPDLDDWLVDLVCDKIFTEENLRGLLRGLHEYHSDWAKKQREKRNLLMNEKAKHKRKLDRLYEVLEDDLDVNVGDLVPRLREHKERVRHFELQILAIDMEQAPQLNLRDDDIACVRSALVSVIKDSDDPQKTRAFFAQFIESIMVGGEEVTIRYRSESLLGTVSETVPSSKNWLLE